MSRRPRLSTFDPSAEGRTIKPENVKAATLQKAKRNAVYAVGDPVKIVEFHSRTAKVDAVVLEFRKTAVYGNQVWVEYAGGPRWVSCERVTARAGGE